MPINKNRPKLSDAPLILVLAQIRFPPVLKMSEHIADIQDALRKHGFPGFEEEQAVVIGPGLSAVAAPRPRSRWIFTNSERTESVVLTESFLVLETNDYDVFGSFTKKFEGVIEILKKTVDIESTERLGLRYINLLREKEGHSAIELLAEDLRGIQDSHYPGVTNLVNVLVSQGQTRFGNIVVRAIQSSDGAILPEDLRSSRLDFAVKLNEGELIAFIDIDHYGSIKKSFSTTELDQVLDEMHEVIEGVFRASVTEDALRLWS